MNSAQPNSRHFDLDRGRRWHFSRPLYTDFSVRNPLFDACCSQRAGNSTSSDNPMTLDKIAIYRYVCFIHRFFYLYIMLYYFCSILWLFDFLCFDPVPWGSDKGFYCILCGSWSLGGAIHWFFWSKTRYKPKGIVIKSIISFFQKKTFVVIYVSLKIWFCAELSNKKSKHCINKRFWSDWCWWLIVVFLRISLWNVVLMFFQFGLWIILGSHRP